jgi:hypothetical protein
MNMFSKIRQDGAEHGKAEQDNARHRVKQGQVEQDRVKDIRKDKRS